MWCIEHAAGTEQTQKYHVQFVQFNGSNEQIYNEHHTIVICTDFKDDMK